MFVVRRSIQNVSLKCLSATKLRFFENIQNSRKFTCSLSSEVSDGLSPKCSDSSHSSDTQTTYISERLYIGNVLNNTLKYPEHVFKADMIAANRDSKNKLVVSLRHLVDGGAWEESEIGRTDFTREHIQNESFTMDDFIEVFYLMPRCWDLLNQQLSIRSVYDLLFKKLRETEKDWSKMLVLLNVMKDVPRIPRTLGLLCLCQFREKVHKLTNTQIIQYFYFLHFYKFKLFNKSETFKFEKYLADQTPNINLDELGVILYSSFRSKSQPCVYLSNAIAQKLLDEFDNINETLASIFAKFINFSERICLRLAVGELLHKFNEIIDNFTLTTAIQIASMGVNINVGNSEMLKRVIEKANGELQSVQLKDIERLLIASLCINLDLNKDSDFIKSLIADLNRRKDEIALYPQSFLNVLSYLIMYGIYLDDQINFALSTDFAKLLPKQSYRKKYHEFLFIDGSLEVERPDYDGERLDSFERRKILQRDIHYTFVKDNKSSWFCNSEIMEGLKAIYGNEVGVLKQILPHYAIHQIILCLNKNGEPEGIGEKLEKVTCEVLRAPEDGNHWLCFVALGTRGYSPDFVTPNYVTRARLRQFQAAGYLPITVQNYSWHRKTPDERTQFLREAIQECLENARKASRHREV